MSFVENLAPAEGTASYSATTESGSLTVAGAVANMIDDDAATYYGRTRTRSGSLFDPEYAKLYGYCTVALSAAFPVRKVVAVWLTNAITRNGSTSQLTSIQVEQEVEGEDIWSSISGAVQGDVNKAYPSKRTTTVEGEWDDVTSVRLQFSVRAKEGSFFGCQARFQVYEIQVWCNVLNEIKCLKFHVNGKTITTGERFYPAPEDSALRIADETETVRHVCLVDTDADGASAVRVEVNDVANPGETFTKAIAEYSNE